MGLLDRWRPLLSVGADGDELFFRRADAEVRQQPIIRVAPDGKIIELGAAALDATGGQLIRLFTENGSDGDEALRAFCRYHMMLVSSASIGLRPRVTLLEPGIRRAFGRDATSQLQRVLVLDGFVVDRVAAT
jgi:hypothetical protein